MKSKLTIFKAVSTISLSIFFSKAAFGAPPKIEVFEDEYVFREIEQSGASVSEKSLSLNKLITEYNVLKGANSKLKLAAPIKKGVQLQAKSEGKIVTYDKKKDKCKSNPIPGYLCSPNYVVRIVAQPNDTYYANGQLWGLNGAFGIDADKAWNYSQGSNDVIVAVIDTGINLTHSDLNANIWMNPNEISGNGVDDDGNGFVDDIRGASMITGGTASDDNGHGSHVAGTICAVGNNSSGVTGVNWRCKILPVKFLNNSGSGSIYDAARAVDYVTAFKNRGFPVVLSNNSWSGGGYSAVLEAAIKNARDAGILFVAAAGNSGQNTDTTPSYPAGYDIDNVISVAAIDSAGNLASFSNYGVKSVDIAAPGVGILSTYIPGSEYVSLSGTSMAAPHVSGALALLKSGSPGLAWSDLRDRLFSQARKLPSLNSKVKTGGTTNAYFMFLPPPTPTPVPTVVPTPACQKNRFKRCTDNCDRQYHGQPNRRKRCWQDCRKKYNCY